MSIKSEKDIEEELVNQQETQNDDRPTRSKISRLGDKLVDTTDQVLKGVKRFLSLFNKVFTHVKLENFVFEEADYVFVSEKEVKEVREIFRAFDIEIKQLKQQ